MNYCLTSYTYRKCGLKHCRKQNILIEYGARIDAYICLLPLWIQKVNRTVYCFYYMLSYSTSLENTYYSQLHTWDLHTVTGSLC